MSGLPLTAGAAVLVVGGANVDLKAQSTAAMVPATSNPGTTVLSPGGVGRNIAENAARLGARVQLASIVGDDALGEDLLSATAAAGVDVRLVQRGSVPTGTYTALLDRSGDLVAAVAAMAVIEELEVAPIVDAIERSAPDTVVVLDGNLPPDTLSALLVACETAALRVVLDPVSVPKAERLAPVLGPPLFLLTPNRDELAALTALPVETAAELTAAAEALRSRAVEWVWVRLGSEGSTLVGPGVTTILSPYGVDVIDVTGAGDAMLGAFCQALAGGADVLAAARFGQAAAALTVASEQTVRPDLTPALIKELLDAEDH
ncbi:carbohydrate kinase family protein [Nocardioides sp. Kera G14]|uniref:carbohydrate kinase family protein n=1 Tax=Nocardioides sp. Kera G14 TaxID=2884264 RepID=UPI001D0F943D|nr:carbohydrate kinase family protein [Nocardioides sp. Kera G14]UDY23526.1 carbohydrate kinase family protein [Nocardioides sp. Kera G14]